MKEKQRIDVFSALLRTVLLLGIFSIGSTALAVDFTQPPSAFDITTDGVFTTPDEWSDVTPAVRLGRRHSRSTERFWCVGEGDQNRLSGGEYSQRGNG